MVKNGGVRMDTDAVEVWGPNWIFAIGEAYDDLTNSGRCISCRLFEAHRADSNGNINTGSCHRYPPGMDGFITVYSTEWCGEYCAN